MVTEEGRQPRLEIVLVSDQQAALRAVVLASFQCGVRLFDSVEHDRLRWCGAPCGVAAADA
jgi:hypothetical protein